MFQSVVLKKNNELLFTLWVWVRVAVAARSSIKEGKGGISDILELYPRNVYIFINQRHPNKQKI